MSDLVLLFVTVPVVTGLIGWVTNWAAVKMIFYPRRFLGVGPLGWQGILYKQSHKFATGVADMATNNLLTARELVARLDMAEMEQMFAATVDAEAERLCEQGAAVVTGEPGAWQALPAHVQAMVTAQVKSKTREINRALFAEMGGIAEELIDLNELVYQQLSGDNVGRLAEFTQKIGNKEFKFIEYYGGVFGFIIGMFQIGVWSVLQRWWLMPIVGIFVGLITNWLAIQMIFRPLEPRKYLGLLSYQGLFPKRQAEIAADYGVVAGQELLTPHNLIEYLTRGDRGSRLLAMITERLSARIDAEWAQVAPMVPVSVTPEQLAEVVALVVRRLLVIAPELRPRIEAYLAGKLRVRETVETKLATLSKADFERVLRGIFEEDELTLILVGGFLGMCVGLGQAALVLAV